MLHTSRSRWVPSGMAALRRSGWLVALVVYCFFFLTIDLLYYSDRGISVKTFTDLGDLVESLLEVATLVLIFWFPQHIFSVGKWSQRLSGVIYAIWFVLFVFFVLNGRGLMGTFIGEPNSSLLSIATALLIGGLVLKEAAKQLQPTEQ